MLIFFAFVIYLTFYDGFYFLLYDEVSLERQQKRKFETRTLTMSKKMRWVGLLLLL